MNRMEFERIKHEEARKATEGTRFDWVDLLDNTEQYERKAMRMSEEDMHSYWKGFFEGSVAAMEWEDE